MLNEQIGHYRITAKLGQGGMGEIFAAHDEKLNRTVAIKFIANAKLDSDSSRRMFLREARAAAGLGHPFICTVHDVIEHDGQPVIVMEHVAGETLQARLSRGSPPIADVVNVAREIVEAIGTAHAHGIVHRDIKPGNIMITPSGHVKVMDFGLALTTTASPEEATAHRSEEMTSRVAGTLPYMAPEVLRGEGAAAPADMFATGVLLYEMVTGRRPFGGNTDAVLIANILHGTLTPARQLNADLPRALDDLIARLLSRNPDARPTPEVVLADLERIAMPSRGKSQRSLAVLPFRVLTADTESAHLGVALADAITSELALVRSLVVRPTAAIIRYGDALADPMSVARDLGVEFVVTGTFQRAGSRLRVSVQLISAAEDRPLWSTKVDTTLEDIFVMQDEVSRKIVDALQVELTPADERRVANRPHVAGDALDLYAQGRLMMMSENFANTNIAIDYFERARELDPSNPLPLTGLGEAYGRLAFSVDPEGDWYDRAKEMVDRAAQLQPDLPEARYLRGLLRWSPRGGFDHQYALTELAAVVAERPNFSEAYDWIGVILFHVGLVDESTAIFERAMKINPDDNLNVAHRATCDTLMGRYADALVQAERALAKVETSWAHYTVATALLHLGDLDAANRRIDLIARKYPGVVWVHSMRSVAAALTGDARRARQEIERTDEERKGFGHFHHAEFDVACALALMDDADAAMQRLHTVVRDGFPCLPAVESNTFLDKVRNHADYRPLIEGLRATREEFREIAARVRLTSTVS